ncbi:MAG: UbiD family decarboxylase [Planctomycetota bacterium]
MRNAPADLRAFLNQLEREGELIRISAEVDRDLEVAEIHRRVIAANGPALLFENVRGCGFPLVTNLFGTQRRVELAFGSRPGDLVRDVARLPEELMPPSLGKLWGKRSLFTQLARVGTKTKSSGPVLEVQESRPALDRLPALRTWARDGGPFLTLPLVLTHDPETGCPNLGMYASGLRADEVGVHMQIGKGGGFHLARAEELGKALPVRIHLGGPPALILSAIAPLPENVPELLLAVSPGVASCPWPAIPTASTRSSRPPSSSSAARSSPARGAEGPFGDHYGYYSEVHDYPWMKVDRLLRRKDAIFPATVVGKPRQEDFYIGDFLQELLSPLFRWSCPRCATSGRTETGYHALSAARVRERYRREAMMSAFRILGEASSR